MRFAKGGLSRDLQSPFFAIFGMFDECVKFRNLAYDPMHTFQLPHSASMPLLPSSLGPRPQLAHLGIYTDHQDEMQAFYERVLGMVVTDTGVAHKFKRRIVFMSSSPDQHHQFVLVRREAGDPPRGPLFQISFKVDSLQAMRELRDRAGRHGARRLRPMNHGNSWSLYFDDPEDNTIEIYLDTPWYVAQPFADDLDLDLSDAEIHRLTETRVRALESFSTAAEWSARMGERLVKTRLPE